MKLGNVYKSSTRPISALKISAAVHSIKSPQASS